MMPKYGNIIDRDSNKGIPSLLKKHTLAYRNITELKPYETKGNVYFLLIILHCHNKILIST
jgi:hypothetical protein